MPPGPAFNWICVAHSALDILNHAARYRAAQLSSPLASQSGQKQQKINDHFFEGKHERDDEEKSENVQADSHFVRPDSLRHANEAWISQISISPFPILPNSPIEPVIETTAQPAQPGLTPAKLQETAVPSAPPPALQSSPSPSVADPNLSLAIDAEHIILSSDVCPIVCTFRTSVSFILSRLIHIRFILKGIDY